MGVTLTQMDLEKAKRVARNSIWKVFEASTEVYFKDKRWISKAILAEYVEERDQIRFGFQNGDFCTVERAFI